MWAAPNLEVSKGSDGRASHTAENVKGGGGGSVISQHSQQNILNIFFGKWSKPGGKRPCKLATAGPGLRLICTGTPLHRGRHVPAIPATCIISGSKTAAQHPSHLYNFRVKHLYNFRVKDSSDPGAETGNLEQDSDIKPLQQSRIRILNPSRRAGFEYYYPPPPNLSGPFTTHSQKP